jgi:hypothetical protein
MSIENTALFIAKKRGYYNNRVVYPNEIFEAPQNILVIKYKESGEKEKEELVAFEKVTSWVEKMAKGK